MASSSQDGVSRTSLSAGYAAHRSGAEAIRVYSMMLGEGSVNLNQITFSTFLMLSSNDGLVDLGRAIHGHILKFGFKACVVVGSSLVDMYSKIGSVHEAVKAFDEIPQRNLVMCKYTDYGTFTSWSGGGC
ncbi:unnamed protein product [Linum trigynum]|uniref:Pentatricopeptide repeat-containing protein n=1 Tax=Linum trigynum TaxID=586398 RepID=A0AAV2E5T2_9ROSI